MDNQERFLGLLKNEILQLDQPELDFGIYRILNYRRTQIEAFFDEHLPALLSGAIDLSSDAEAAAAASDPDSVPFAQSELDRLYNYLYTFFSRYYRDGDFEPQPRRSREARFSAPYNGEDVHFFWRSFGSNYVKTTEELRSYRFRAGTQVVRFELVDADEEPDNVKGASRYFVPLTARAEMQAGPTGSEFVVPFAFQRLSSEEGNKYGTKTEAIEGDSIQERVLADLADALVLPDGVARADLLRHMRRYATKARRDYFVHPRLGQFLTTELDFFLKNEVLDVEAMSSREALDDRLRKVLVLREAGSRLIDLLDDLESIQVQLFEKRRFVLRSAYLIPIRLLPDSCWDLILANESQLNMWREECRLGVIDHDVLNSSPSLVVDTRLFKDADVRILVGLLDPLDQLVDGLLVHGENFGALRSLLPSFRGRVRTVYIDPPYNTGSDEFIYKDDFSRHSAWLALMESRLRLGRSLLSQDGSFLISIDDNEQANLKQLADQVFGPENFITSMVWEGGLKNDSRFVSVSHDYIVTYAKNLDYLGKTGVRWRTRKEGVEEIYEEVERLRAEHAEDYAAMSDGLKEWYRAIGRTHPAYAHRHYWRIDPRGVYFADNISWPGGGGPKYPVLHPVTQRPVKIPRPGWRYSTPERMAEMVASDRVHFGPDETTVPNSKRYLHETEGQVVPSVFYRDRRASTKDLRHIFGDDRFDNPKDVPTLMRLIEGTTGAGDWVADYFGGSGSTAHAVIALNRELESHRRFLVVEMGAHFWSVTLPRVRRLMYSADWHDGRPSEVQPPLVPANPNVVKVLTLERYEDSLSGLELSGAPARLDRPLHYVVSDQAAVGLATTRLEHPFSYTLPVQTEDGVRDVAVDLAETFSLLAGVAVDRVRWAQHGERDYQLVVGRRGGDSVLVVWRDVENLDPASELAFLIREAPDLLGRRLEEFHRVWHNADSVIPQGESLDGEFHRLMFEPELGS